MPVCFLCLDNFSTFSHLNLHFKYAHSLGAGSGIQCREGNCTRKCTNIKAYGAHLRRYHNENENVPAAAYDENFEENEQDEDPAHDDILENENPPLNLDETFELIENLNIQNFLLEQCALFTSKLNAHPSIPRNLCQTIVDFTTDLMTSCTSIMHTKVMHAINGVDGVNADDLHEIEACFQTLKEPFKHVSSDHLRRKFFKERGSYISPKDFSFGEKVIMKTIKKKKKIMTVDKVGQHVPLTQSLKLFFEYNNLLNETFEFMEILEEENCLISNVIQGSEWRETIEDIRKNHPGRKILPLVLFCDDYEAGNPLGSHAGINKLSGVYATVPCLPPKVQSSLNSILLCLLFKSSDRKDVSNEALFRVIVEELKFLSETGIEIQTPASSVNVHFVLCHLAGDHLGLHQMCDFVQNFSTAKHMCRICRVEIDQMHTQVTENEANLRTPENYAADVSLNNVTETGVTANSLWNEVPHFSVVRHLASDILHDQYEGCAGYLLVFLFNYLIDSGLITYQVLCVKIEDFDYGLIDQRSKPPNFSKNFNRNSIKMSGAEMKTLVKYLPLILGNRVPEDDEVWNLFLKYRNIIDLLMAPSLQVGSSDLLNALVAEYLSLYQSLTNTHLVYKHHMMIHYGRFIKKLAPLRKLWCIRFEAKHRQFKVPASSNFCQKNTPKTLAIKHQLQFSDAIFSNCLFRPDLDYGPTTPVRLLNFQNFHVQAQFTSFNFPPKFLQLSWLRVGGFIYKPTLILFHDEVDDIPCFSEILKIWLLPNDVVFFLCALLENVGFRSHYHAFHVKQTKVYTILPHNTLQCQEPTILSRIPNGELYVMKPYM